MKGIYEQGKILTANLGSFAENLSLLRSVGAESISLRDYAKEIQENPPESAIHSPGGYTREGIIYIPEEKILLVRDSPLIKQETAYALVKMLKKGEEARSEEVRRNGSNRQEARRRFESLPFAIDPTSYLNMVEEDRNKDPEDKRVIEIDTKYISDNGLLDFPIENLENEEIFRWAFRDQAKDHADHLRDFTLRDSFIGVVGNDKIRDNGGRAHVLQFRYSPAESGEFGLRENSKYLYGPVLGLKR